MPKPLNRIIFVISALIIFLSSLFIGGKISSILYNFIYSFFIHTADPVFILDHFSAVMTAAARAKELILASMLCLVWFYASQIVIFLFRKYRKKNLI